MAPSRFARTPEGPLDARLRADGAVMLVRDGVVTAAHFGSVAGEEAVCVSRVGIAARSDLVAYELDAPPDALPLGAARRSDLTWRLRVDPDRLLVVAPRGVPAPADARSADLAVLSLIGPRLRRLLRACGATPSLGVGMVEACELGGRPVWLVREDDRHALVLAASGDIAAVWACVTTSGRELGASHVGSEALERLGAARLVSLA